MVSVRVNVEPEDFDRLIATLWDSGTAGITEGDGFVDAFFEDADRGARVRRAEACAGRGLGRSNAGSVAAAASGEAILSGGALEYRSYAGGAFAARD